MSDEEFLEYKGKFFRWAKVKWSVFDENTIEEVFLDAISIYVENDRKGKVNVPPFYYIKGVGQNKFSKRWGNRGKSMELKIDPPIEEDSYQKCKEILRKNLAKLGEKCQTLLIGKFFYKLSARDLKEELGAASEDVIRQLQRKCRNKLKDLFDAEDLVELGFI